MAFKEAEFKVAFEMTYIVSVLKFVERERGENQKS